MLCKFFSDFNLYVSPKNNNNNPPFLENIIFQVFQTSLIEGSDCSVNMENIFFSRHAALLVSEVLILLNIKKKQNNIQIL